MGDKPTIKPKFLAEDFATEPSDSAEAGDRYRLAQARALLESPVVLINGLPCYHVEMEDGSFRDIPTKDVDTRGLMLVRNENES